MFANLRNALLLATSNRSEAAVGYATMDGDTSGGLSPIAGIDKHYLRSWLRWMETTGLPESGPIPALSAINNQQPTAELRPKADKQTDEADLMPYPVLDTMERAAIRDKKGPAAVLKVVRIVYPEYSEEQLKGWTIKFFKLWCRNQWKRERYAVSFHVDDQNLDPKTWCRFPILSAGFTEELTEL
jgi:NAD+ synthase (glutamine-hydrolysing)